MRALPPGRAAKSSKGKGDKEYKRVSELDSSDIKSVSSSITSTVSLISLVLRANVEVKIALLVFAAAVANADGCGVHSEVGGRREGDECGLKATRDAFITAMFKANRITADIAGVWYVAVSPRLCVLV